MAASVTINSTTTELYDSAELKALLGPILGGIGHIDGVKYKYRIPTFRLFSSTGSNHKVMHAPNGFTWDPGVKAASATTMTTRRNYYGKAYVDALVVELSA